jgi:GTP-binding protein HflX
VPGSWAVQGETQIEADRRQIQERIIALQKQLESVRRTRELHRKKRKKIPQPVVALVGYTNAGKSTLFNRLTESEVFAKDLLFATLDPTLRKITLPHGREVILSDTVGLHFGSADPSGGRLPCNTGRGSGSRSDPACARYRIRTRTPRPRTSRRPWTELGVDALTGAPIIRGLEQDRSPRQGLSGKTSFR